MRKTSKHTVASPKRSAAPRRSVVARVLVEIAKVAERRELRWFLFGA